MKHFIFALVGTILSAILFGACGVLWICDGSEAVLVGGTIISGLEIAGYLAVVIHSLKEGA